MSKNNFWDEFWDIIITGIEAGNETIRKQEEEKSELRKEFKMGDNQRIYTRGTVITAMADQGWDRFDMNRVLDEVTNPERAEAAVDLIRTGNYDAFDVKKIIENL